MSDTPLDLDAIRARYEAATEGPWWAWDRGVGWHIAVGTPANVDEHGRPLRLLPEGDRTDIRRAADAEFIAYARADIPILLAEVERLRAEVDRLDSALTAADLATAAAFYAGFKLARKADDAAAGADPGVTNAALAAALAEPGQETTA